MRNGKFAFFSNFFYIDVDINALLVLSLKQFSEFGGCTLKKIRVFVDTSVFGGCFDIEFQVESLAFFDQVMAGRYQVVASETVFTELSTAPNKVQEFVQKLPNRSIELVYLSRQIKSLRDKYIDSGVISRKNFRDAEHIASATIAEVDYIVSWNFKHIVQYEKINGYNRVNVLNGHKKLNICSPKDIINYAKT